MIRTMRKMASESDTLAALQERYDPLIELIREKAAKEGIEAIKMLESDLGCLMVVARGRLMGIVTERDLLRAAADVLARQAT